MSKKDPDTVILTYREEGTLNRRRLSGILGASTTFLLLLLIVALSLGAVGAAGIGIGGFVVEFSDVTAPSGSVYPAIGQQSECENAPQLMATLNGQATIDGYFKVSKGIPIPGDVVDGISVNILSEATNSSPIAAEDLDLRLIALSSQELVLSDSVITENRVVKPESNRTDLPNTSYADTSEVEETGLRNVDVEFGVNASGGLGIRGGRALVYQIAFGNIELGGLGVNASTYESEKATLAGGRYDCNQLHPPQKNSDGEYVLPDGRNVTAPAEPVSAGESGENVTKNTSETRSMNETVSENRTEPEGEPEIEVVDVQPSRDTAVEVGDKISVEINVSNVGNATERWRVYAEVQEDEENVTVGEEIITLRPSESTYITLAYEATPYDVPEVGTTIRVEQTE